MALTPIVTQPQDVFWTITDPAYKVSGDNSLFVGEYIRNPNSYAMPLIIPGQNMRCYPAFKPAVSHIHVTMDVEISGVYTPSDWLSFATFSSDTFGTRVLTFNLTSTTGYHFTHTLDQNSVVNDYLKPMPYSFPTQISIILDVIAGGNCSATVNGELVAQSRFLGVSMINLTHYGLYTSPTTQYLKVKNSNVIEYAVT
jgi:hypothetical protein